MWFHCKPYASSDDIKGLTSKQMSTALREQGQVCHVSGGCAPLPMSVLPFGISCVSSAPWYVLRRPAHSPTHALPLRSVCSSTCCAPSHPRRVLPPPCEANPLPWTDPSLQVPHGTKSEMALQLLQLKEARVKSGFDAAYALHQQDAVKIRQLARCALVAAAKAIAAALEACNTGHMLVLWVCVGLSPLPFGMVVCLRCPCPTGLMTGQLVACSHGRKHSTSA